MKSKSYIFLTTAVLAVSCASTPKELPVQTQEEVVAEVSETAPVEEEPVASPVDKAQLAYEEYAARFSDLMITVTGSPKEVMAGKEFATPYTVKAAKADGSPYAALALTVTYPATRTADASSIVYATATVTTAEDGTASFMPPATTRSFAADVCFSPAVEEEHATNEQIQTLVAGKTVTAPYTVRTRYMRSGGNIAIVDYSASGKPITVNSDSSSKLLAELMKKGFSGIGNADFTTQVVSGDKDAVYTAAKRLLGNVSSYIIYGTVKYAKAIEKTEQGYCCTLDADISCLNMKDGTLLYHTTFTEQATAASESAALTNTRIAVAKKLSQEIYYGM